MKCKRWLPLAIYNVIKWRGSAHIAFIIIMQCEAIHPSEAACCLVALCERQLVPSLASNPINALRRKATQANMRGLFFRENTLEFAA